MFKGIEEKQKWVLKQDPQGDQFLVIGTGIGGGPGTDVHYEVIFKRGEDLVTKSVDWVKENMTLLS